MPRDLTPLFEPRSVAIVGVSADAGKWGYWFARDAVKGAHRRRVFLVGRSGGELFGLPVHRELAELPEAPELVVLAVPAAGLEEAVDASLAAGARALVAIAAGLGEQGPDGLARERALVERVRAAGAVLLGPNCLGVFDAAAELDLASNPVPSGPVGLVSQSGNIALETGLLLRDVGLGFSRLASIGNQADLDATELVAALGEHEPTRAIAVYCEDFRDGRAFAEAARAAGKPVLLLTVGRTAAAARAAHSHTGALTSDLDAVDAACRLAGVHRVDTPRQLVDAVQALLSPLRPRGRRIGVVGDGGGYGAVASDLLGASGLELPVLARATQDALRAGLTPNAATANPVDLAGAGEQDTFSFARATRTVLEADEVDAALFTAYFGGYSTLSDELREREVAVAGLLAEAAAETGKPLVVHTMHWDAPPARALRAAGVPVYRAIESAVAALAVLAADAEADPRALPALPPPARPLADSGYAAAREALAEAGIAFAAARTVRGSEEALAAAEELGFPVVVKALGLLHKSDAGGVVVGLRDRRRAPRRPRRPRRPARPGRALRRAPGGRRRGLRAARRRPPRPALRPDRRRRRRRHPRRDRSATPRSRSRRSSPAEAAALLRSLACAPLLEGARGRPPLDLAAAADAVAALSRFAAAHPEIAEVEINPLLVRREGAVGLDARIVLHTGG